MSSAVGVLLARVLVGCRVTRTSGPEGVVPISPRVTGSECGTGALLLMSSLVRRGGKTGCSLL